MGIGDWGLGIGDWGLGPIPNPQSPPPSAQNRANSVRARSNLRSNVVDLINDSFAIVGPARSEDIVSHALTVQEKLVGP